MTYIKNARAVAMLGMLGAGMCSYNFKAKGYDEVLADFVSSAPKINVVVNTGMTVDKCYEMEKIQNHSAALKSHYRKHYKESGNIFTLPDLDEDGKACGKRARKE